MNETACVVCPHVFASQRPVRILIHHGDGTWQATCSGRDHVHDCSDFEVVGIEHLLERQADLRATMEINLDQIAEWDDGNWIVSKFDENEAD